jgi:hypothetical protein
LSSAYAVVRSCIREVLTTGTYAALAGGLGYDELNALTRD